MPDDRETDCDIVMRYLCDRAATEYIHSKETQKIKCIQLF